MNWKQLIFIAAGVLLGFAGGFIFADTANRKEQEKLRAEVARLREGGQTAAAQAAAGEAADGEPKLADLSDDKLRQLVTGLTVEQLRKLVAGADANPGDAYQQRMAGLTLYLYAVQKGDASTLPEAVRILRRAHEGEPNDVDILLRLANALYIMARSGEAGRMAEARGYLEKAAALRPNDADIRASLGLTYFHDRPSDPPRAAREFRRALDSDPRSELSLQGIAAALLASGEFGEAEKWLKDLERVNPSNESLPDLRAQLAQKRNAARERN